MPKHAFQDPNLPPDGDYPTDEIDVWPLLAQGPPPANVTVDDNGAHHDKRTGRYTKKDEKAKTSAVPQRPTVVKRFGEGDDAREMVIRVFTWDEIADLPCGPEPEIQAIWAERFPEGGPNFWEWPVDPGQGEATSRGRGVTSACAPASSATVRVEPPRDRRYIEPEAEWLRGWGQRHGFPVKARGPIPQAIRDAYRKAWEAQQQR